MKIGDKITDHLNDFEQGREWHEQTEFVNAIRRNPIVWSWGATAWTTMGKYALRFKVNGYLHKGHVYLSVNASDLFVVTLTTIRGKITNIIDDVYIDNIIDVIDGVVERKTT